MSQARKDAIVQNLINNKVATLPLTSARPNRVGKFTSTGIFDAYPPTEAQIERVARNYDNLLFGSRRADLIPRFLHYNPDLTFFIYLDSGLNPDFQQSDAGGVDDEGTLWIVENHPDWLLQDQDGNLIRSGGGLSNPGEYWPNPGNPEWQAYFVEKVTKLLAETGSRWDGILFDQFIGTADGHARYAKTAQQVNYPTDEAFQAAYLEFFEAVTAQLPVPLIVNMEGASIIRDPSFVAKVAFAAGGVENEIFPEEMPPEDLRPYLETVQSLPASIHVRINSKPAGIAGDVDRTLFAYYCYLLLASRNQEVYWTYKEGASDIPHYWYREFDLDLGDPQGNIHFDETLWSRQFQRGVVLVNPYEHPGEYAWDPDRQFYDVTGSRLNSPVRLPGRSALLLVSDLSILP